MEKKKIAIVAIIIFIFAGLMVFTFANPEEEEKPGTTKPGENTHDVVDPEKQNEDEEVIDDEEASESRESAVDDSYDKALKAVEDAEKLLTREAYNKAVALVAKSSKNKSALTERLEKVDHDLDVQELVNDLNNKLASATSRDDILAAISFRDEKSINDELVATVNNAELKGTLETLMTEINAVLDDVTVPSINLDKEYYNENVTVSFEDDNELVITVSKDGEEAEEVENGSEFSEEGTYTVTATDKAFNETTYTFTIDKTKPTMNVANVGVTGEDDPTTVLNHIAGLNKTINFTGFVSEEIDLNSIEFYLVQGENEYRIPSKNVGTTNLFGVNMYLGNIKVDANITLADGYVDLVARNVKDLAGNVAEDMSLLKEGVTLLIDRTAPVITVKDSSVGTKNIYSVVDFKITDNFNLKKAVLNDSYTTNKDGASRSLNFANYGSKYVEGKNTWVVYDEAGNTATYTFTYDITAPTMNVANVGVTGEDDPTAVLNHIAGLNKTINFTGFVSEEIDLNSIEFYLVQGENEYKIPSKNIGTTNLFGTNMYIGNIKVDANITLADGYVDLVARNVKDLAGNVAEDMSLLGERITLLIDRTAPVITVKDSSIGTNNIYSVVDFKINDNFNLKKAVLNDTYTVNKDGASRSLNFANYGSKYVEGKNTWVVYDEAGNTATYTFTYDITAPTMNVAKVGISGEEGTVLNHLAGPKMLINFNGFINEKIDINAIEFYLVQGEKEYKINTASCANLSNSCWYIGSIEVTDAITLADGYVDLVARNVKDLAGNVAADISLLGEGETLTIDRTSPKLTLNGEAKATLVSGTDTYTELGAEVVDNYDETRTIYPDFINFTPVGTTKTLKVTGVDMKKPGVYKIVYKTTDAAGNKSVDAKRDDHNYVQRNITVIDVTAPTLKLNGEAKATLVSGTDTYTELGAEFVDDCDETRTIYPDFINFTPVGTTKTIKVTSVDMNKPGLYKIVYKATDASGNAALDVKRADHNYVQRNITVKDVTPATFTSTRTVAQPTSFEELYNGTQNISTVLTFNEEVKIKSFELLHETDATGNVDNSKIVSNTGETFGTVFTFNTTVKMGNSDSWDHAKVTFVDRSGNKTVVYELEGTNLMMVPIETN